MANCHLPIGVVSQTAECNAPFIKAHCHLQNNENFPKNSGKFLEQKSSKMLWKMYVPRNSGRAIGTVNFFGKVSRILKFSETNQNSLV